MTESVIAQNESAPIETPDATGGESEQSLSSSEGQSSPEGKKESALPESQKEMKQFVKELKLKVNGKEISRKIDLNDEAALIKDYQMLEANKNAMQKSAEYEKAFDTFLKDLETDPKATLKKLGKDPDKMMEEWVNQKLEEMKKTPEQLERESFLKEKEELARLKKEEEDKIKRREQDDLVRQHTEMFEKDFSSFFQKYPDAPEDFKNEIRFRAVKLMEKYLPEAPELKLSEVLPYAEEEYFKTYNRMIESAPVALLEKMFGKKGIDKIRLENVKKIQNSQTKTLSNSESAKSLKPKESAPKMNSKDFFRNLGNK